MVRTSVTFTGGNSGSRSKSHKARKASKRKKLASKRGTIREAVRRELLNTTTSGLLGIEKKYVDINHAGAIMLNPVTSGGIPSLAYAEDNETLCRISQGTGPTQRVGHKCTLLSVYCRGEVLFPGAAGIDLGAGTYVRNQHVFLALVLDKQANGARPDASEIYTESLGGTFGSAGPLRNMANSARFRVLKQWDYYRNMEGLAQNAATCDLPEIRKKWEWSMKLNLPLTYLPSSTTGYMADLTDNALHLVAYYEDNGIQASPHIAYSMRFRFTG